MLLLCIIIFSLHYLWAIHRHDATSERSFFLNEQPIPQMQMQKLIIKKDNLEVEF